MFSTIDGLGRLEIHPPTTQLVILTTRSEGDQDEWCFALSLTARLVAYLAILALLVIVFSMILKCLEDFDWERPAREATQIETNPLLPEKAMPPAYGTQEKDLESGNCSSSSSSKDLYDGKICIICYDEQRNCFFVPCGHCATCYACAQRIFYGENKTCPVCRRLIRRVRKLFVGQNQDSS